MVIFIFVRVWEKNKRYYASVVENKRVGNKVIQSTKLYIGEVKAEQIPYLKAAYAKNKPKLLYKDGSIYEG